ncbi:MAG: CBU_0592 family membrane protein [Caulobacteraceae bacterium]
MRFPDAAGIVGVVLMLGAYIGAQTGRLDPARAPSLLLNLIGPALVIFSLMFTFNLPAFLTEAAWATAATFGLVRLALKRR